MPSPSAGPQPTPAAGKPPAGKPPAATTGVSDPTRAFMADAYSAFAALDLDAIAAMFAEGVVFHVAGRHQLAEFWDSPFDQFAEDEFWITAGGASQGR